MGKNIPIEFTKIKKIAADIQEFPTDIDSAERAKSARQLLKKYALLSEKIERNVLIRAGLQKDLAKIRTVEFKEKRQKLKEKANSILQAKNIKNDRSEKNKTKSVKKPTAKKPEKVADVNSAKEKDSKKTVKKPSPKPSKKITPKEST